MIGKTNAVIGGSGGESVAVITFTVEGAKGDNISITDANGATIGNVIFDTNSTSAEHTMTIPLIGGVYTFTSSVAKDTTTGTADYSKNVMLSPVTENIKVMPEGAIIWGANEVIPMSVASWKYASSGYTALSPTKEIVGNTVNLTMAVTSASYGNCTGTYLTNDSIDVSKYSKVKAICRGASTSTYQGGSLASYLCAIDNRTSRVGDEKDKLSLMSASKGMIEADISTLDTTYVGALLWETATGNQTVYAYIDQLWLE